ncbi:MAG: matrixin family metalloprotease, partial [Planctomycetota bacterium]
NAEVILARALEPGKLRVKASCLLELGEGTIRERSDVEANPLPTPPPLPRGRGRLFLAVAMAAGILLAAQGLVVAFELLGQSWASPFATFRVNPNFPQEAGGSAQQQVDAIRCGASAWESEGRSNFRFVYQGTTSIEAVNNLDGVNALFWSATNPAGGLALASTFFTWDANDHYIGFDVVYWGANDNGPLIWNGLGDPQPGEYDIRAVATHELGHTFGLGHTSIAEATMYTFYGGVGMRTLHPDDIEGVQFLYGAGAQPPPQPSINDILPPVGPDSGGNEVVIAGESFSATEDTLLTIDGAALAGGAFEVESCGTVRIFAMPPHDPGRSRSAAPTRSAACGSRAPISTRRRGRRSWRSLPPAAPSRAEPR